MPLKDMRVRIASTKATQKITKAMQMVAASKLRRAQAAAEAARPYAERMEKVLGNIAAPVTDIDSAPKLLGRHRPGPGPSAGGLHRRARPVRRVQLVDRAAGARADQRADRRGQDRQDSSASAARAPTSSAGSTRSQIIEVIELRVKTLGFEHAEQVGEKILELYEKGEFDVATLFFSRFKSVISQIPTALQIIPPVFEADDRGAPTRSTNTSRTSSTFSTELLPRNISVQVFRALLENAASEQGARMSAMDNATRNAGEMIRKQTITYNRTRQAMITKELIEIISGAEAL